MTILSRLHYVLCLVLAFALYGCQDDELGFAKVDVPEGRPARVAIRYTVPEQPVVESRSMIDEDLARTVTSLWVGVFSQSDRRLTYSQVFRKIPRGDGDLPLTGEGEPLYIYPPSGAACMFAVANIDSNYGIHENDTEDNEIHTVADLLAGVHSVRDYCNLAAVLLEPTQVNKVTGNLMMSGVYVPAGSPHDGTPHPESLFTGDDVPGKVNIMPGENTLTGFIRLCRHASYIKFNITSDPNIKLTMESWQVHDVPALSLLAERDDLNGGDLPNGLNSHPKYPSNYNSSEEENYFTYQKDDDIWNFDFYLFGNRRTGLDWVTSYRDRDVQYKRDDGLNTGAFRSLISPQQYADGEVFRTHSPYVTVKMRAEYYVLPTSDQDLVDVNASLPPVPPTTPGAIPRRGEFTTIIHLGYCEGATEAEKARDFTVHRDYKYTYNLHVDGIDNVRVEAVGRTLERQPGLSGLVTDAMTSIVGLDAHYSAFNIKISNLQRQNFRYSIRAAFGDEQIEFENQTRAQLLSSHREQFYDWVQFAPALDSVHLAAYPGTQNYLTSKLWSLDQLGDPVNYPGYNPVANVTASTTPAFSSYPGNQSQLTAWQDQECWYTVFVNEHVYDRDLTGNPLPASDWTKYCNTSGRSCSLQVLESHTSADRESRYLHSIIYIQQKSISTFFATTGVTAGDNVMGVEHHNESFGRNMLWTLTASGWEENNGRYNVIKWAINNNHYGWNGTSKNILLNLTTADGSKWNIADHAPDVYFDNQLIQERQRTFTPALRPFTQSGSGTLLTQNNDRYAYYPDPANHDIYEAMAMCLGRNRDLDGDGVISAGEVRWVIPGIGEMELMMIGNSGLPDPIIDYNFAIPSLPYTAWPQELKNGIYHFLASSKHMLWADQHTVYGAANQVQYKPDGKNCGSYYDDNQGNYWQIRCIRPICSSMETQATTTSGRWYTRPIQYTPNTSTTDNYAGTVTTNYLNPLCTSDPVTSAIPYHGVAQAMLNKSYKEFQVGRPVRIDNLNGNASWVNMLALGANPVLSLGQGWRVPTIQELMTMYRLDILQSLMAGIQGNYAMVSCTRDEYLQRTLGIYVEGGAWTPNAIADYRMSDGFGAHYVIPVKDVIRF